VVSTRKEIGEGWRTAGVLAVCALLLAPTLAYRMGLDQGVFAYLGAELLHGHWPYLDTWDHAFPGLMFLQALEILILGKSIVAFRLFDLAWQLASLLFLYRITRRLAGRAAGLFAAGTFALIYQSYGPWNTGQREGFAMLFALAGFWLYLTAERRRPRWTAFCIGLGLGLAVTIKPTMLALAALYVPLARRPDRRTVTLAATALAGLALPPLAFALLYLAKGGLHELIDACFVYQAQVYVPRLRGTDPLLVFWLSKLRHLGGTTLGLLVAYPPFLLLRRERATRLMLYLGYLGCAYAVFAQGTFAGYHYLPGLALGAILLGTAFSLTLDLVWPRRRAAVTVALAALALLAGATHYLTAARVHAVLDLGFLGPPRPGEYTNGTVFDFTEDWQLAEHLRRGTRPDERVQVWGHESLVYYLAERRAASRFQTSNPLVMRVAGRPITPLQERWRTEFIEDQERNRPVYVAVVRDDHWWWAPGERSSEELLDDFPEWKARIARDYRLERTIGRFLVYRRADVAELAP